MFEIIFATMMLPSATRQLAGRLLTLAVTPVNIHMWVNPERFPDVEPWFLSLRLVVQALLLIIIWLSTRNATWGRTN